MRLPVELYRVIMQHLSLQQLAPLLLCNHSFRLEAAPLIFRYIDLRHHKNADDARTISFHEICQQVGVYVYRFNIFMESEQMEILRRILLELPNLKELTVKWGWGTLPCDQFAPSDLPFELHTLMLYHHPMPDTERLRQPTSPVERFIKSQRMSLRRLGYIHNIPFDIPFDLPLLRVLEAGKGCSAKLLKLGTLKCFSSVSEVGGSWLRGPYPSIRSLVLSVYDDDTSTIPALFPNLRYLQHFTRARNSTLLYPKLSLGYMQDYDQDFASLLPSIPSLEKLCIGTIIGLGPEDNPFRPSNSQNRAPPLFEKFPELRFVCMTAEHMVSPRWKSWVYGRESEPIYVEDEGEVVDDWVLYQDDNYETRA